MEEYLKVEPSSERIQPSDVVEQLSALHNVDINEDKIEEAESDDEDIGGGSGLRGLANQMVDFLEVERDISVPKFEFLLLVEGMDSPVEMLYTTEGPAMDKLEARLRTAYPDSFDIERVEIDLLKKVVPPAEFEPRDFVKKFENGELQYDDTVPGSPEDISGDGEEVEAEDSKPILLDVDSTRYTETDLKSPDHTTGHTPVEEAGDADKVETASQFVKDTSPAGAVADSAGERESGAPDEYAYPQSMEADLPEAIQNLSRLDASEPVANLDGPAWTEDGTIMARPSLERGTAVACEWHGKGKRAKDWMTTMKFLSDRGGDNDDDGSRSPLSTLIQGMTDADYPIAFQVVFEPLKDWSNRIDKRKRDIHLDRDSWSEKIQYAAREAITPENEERRREKNRDYFDSQGESTDQDVSDISGRVTDRKASIDLKNAQRTFRTNIRAVSVAVDDTPVDEVRDKMDELSASLDNIEGQFYTLNANISDDTEDGEGSGARPASRVLDRFLDKEINFSTGRVRPDLTLNADELANFIAVPSSPSVTVEGGRGIRAEMKSHNPLPLPNPDIMRHYHKDGIRVGYALDEDHNPEPVPTQISPDLMPLHILRAAKTGGGKSKGLINDVLSGYENTSGPTIIIDPKGDGLPKNLLRSFYARDNDNFDKKYGAKGLKDNIIYFDVPEDLPGFSIFNIERELERGMRREDAITRKINQYKDIMRITMGEQEYDDSTFGPTVTSALIKALFDEEGHKTREGRTSPNYFPHHDLERAAEQLRKWVIEDDPQAGNKPFISDGRIDDIFERYDNDEVADFQKIISAVLNRLDIIRNDIHLRSVFYNTERQFDFDELLDEDKIIIFDMGDLTEEPTKALTGVIMTQLWQSLKSHSQSTCEKGHDTLQECHEYSEDYVPSGVDPSELEPSLLECRTEWSDDHVVNLMMDEAASLVVSNTLSRMLEQGRSFNLSVTLSMQYPGQMKRASNDNYQNVLKNMHSMLLGDIGNDKEVARMLANDEIDPEDFQNRINALPRGEMIAQLPDPKFGEKPSEAFNLRPLPIPAGHEESLSPLDRDAEMQFQHFLQNQLKPKVKEKYALDRDKVGFSGESGIDTLEAGPDDEDDEDDDDGDGAAGASSHNGYGGGPDGSGQAGHGDSEDVSDLQSDPPSVGSRSETNGQSTESSDHTEASGNNAGIGGEDSLFEFHHDPDGDPESHPNNIPDGVTKAGGVLVCDDCGEEYGLDEQVKAANCACQGTSTAGQSKPTAADGQQTGTDGGTQAAAADAVPDGVTPLESPSNDDGHAAGQGGRAGEPDGPRAPIGESDLHGGPNTYVWGHVNSENVIMDPTGVPAAINTWNRSSVVAVGCAVIDVFPEESPYAETEALKPLATAAGWHEVALPDDEYQAIAEIRYAAHVLDFDSADIQIDRDSFLEAFGELIGVRPRHEMATSDTPSSGALGMGYQCRQYDDIVVDTEKEPTSTPKPRETPETRYERPDRLERVTHNLSLNEARQSPLSSEELKLLAALTQAMNGNHPGYDLTESMTQIVDLYDADIDRLVEMGYVKKHLIRGRHLYYTVTKPGRDNVGMKKANGPARGDLGDEVPHRVGVTLAAEVLSRHEDVAFARRFESISEGGHSDPYDAVIEGKDGDVKSVVEVEWTKYPQTASAGWKLRGSSDEESIIDDYRKLKIFDEDVESVWVVAHLHQWAAIMKLLDRKGEISADTEHLEQYGPGSGLSIDDANAYLEKEDFSGMERVYTYDSLRRELND